MLRPSKAGVTLFVARRAVEGGPILLANTKRALTPAPAWRLWADRSHGRGLTPSDKPRVPQPPRLLRLPVCPCPLHREPRPLPRPQRLPPRLLAACWCALGSILPAALSLS